MVYDGEPIRHGQGLLPHGSARSPRHSDGPVLGRGPLLLALWLTGCASSVQVTPLATGQVKVQAYELRGADPASLRSEAARLCGGTGAVLRESESARQSVAGDGRWQHWWSAASNWVTQAPREAQLMVRCDEQALRERVASTAPAANPVPGPSGALAAGTPAASPARSAVSSWLDWLVRRKPPPVDSAVPYGY